MCLSILSSLQDVCSKNFNKTVQSSKTPWKGVFDTETSLTGGAAVYLEQQNGSSFSSYNIDAEIKNAPIAQTKNSQFIL